ncbi:amidohydrolase family protein, partial [Streptomyces sp. SID7982]|nr:amidohydrolase family protein [Streptomyces sp. SID7982]
KAKSTPPGEWIVCTPVGEPHYFIRRSYQDLLERRLPDRWTLDRASEAHPVMIEAWAPKIPNAVAFNSAALRALGLTAFTPDRVADVDLEKDEKGDLTGILRGPVTNYYTFDPYWGQILTKLPKPTAETAIAGTLAELGRYTAQGVTTIYEAHVMEPEHVALYRHLRNDGALAMRVMATFDVESASLYPFDALTSKQFDERLRQLGGQAMELDDDLFRLNGLTLSPGGPCFSGYFATYEPYLNPFGRKTRGVRLLSLEKEEAFVRYCAENGIRANICVG